MRSGAADQVEAEYKAFRERESKGADNSGGTSHPEDPAGVSEDAAQLVAADSGELTSEVILGQHPLT